MARLRLIGCVVARLLMMGAVLRRSASTVGTAAATTPQAQTS